jgi:hypothetical protein
MEEFGQEMILGHPDHCLPKHVWPALHSVHHRRGSQPKALVTNQDLSNRTATTLK